MKFVALCLSFCWLAIEVAFGQVGANISVVVPPGMFGANNIVSVMKWDKKNGYWFLGVLGVDNKIYIAKHVDTAKPVELVEFYDIPNVSPQEGSGILSIVLDTSYAKTGLMYIYVTEIWTEDIYGYKDCVFSLQNKKGKAKNIQRLWCSNEDGYFENGGAMMLYKYQGEKVLLLGNGFHTLDASTAQNPLLSAGKFVVVPTSGESFYLNGFRNVTYGNRNPFRITQDPKSSNIWFTEPGPDCNDELNLFNEGDNYGWGPHWNCTVGTAPQNTNQDGPNPHLPSYWTTNPPSIRPDTFTGLDWCIKCGIPALEGLLLSFTFNNGAKIYSFDFTGADRKTVVMKGIVAWNGAPVVDAARGKGNQIYFVDVTQAISKLVPA